MIFESSLISTVFVSGKVSLVTSFCLLMREAIFTIGFVVKRAAMKIRTKLIANEITAIMHIFFLIISDFPKRQVFVAVEARYHALSLKEVLLLYSLKS